MDFGFDAMTETHDRKMKHAVNAINVVHDEFCTTLTCYAVTTAVTQLRCYASD